MRITDTLAEILRGNVVIPLIFVYLELDPPFRAVSGWTDITIDQQTWYSVGYLGRIGTVAEALDASCPQISLILTGIPAQFLGQIIGTSIRGKFGNILFSLCNSDYSLVAQPQLIYRGVLDSMTVQTGSVPTVSCTLTNRLVEWERSRSARFTDEEQRLRYADDLGLTFVSNIGDLKLIWGGV
jgi:hypothetical protein